MAGGNGNSPVRSREYLYQAGANETTGTKDEDALPESAGIFANSGMRRIARSHELRHSLDLVVLIGAIGDFAVRNKNKCT